MHGIQAPITCYFLFCALFFDALHGEVGKEVSSSSTSQGLEAPFYRNVPLYPHDFEYNAKLDMRDPKRVYLLGSFNGDLEQTYSTLLLEKVSPDLYRKRVWFPEGVYRYNMRVDLGDSVLVYNDFAHDDPDLKGVNEISLANVFYAGPQPLDVKDRRQSLGNIRLDLY